MTTAPPRTSQVPGGSRTGGGVFAPVAAGVGLVAVLTAVLSFFSDAVREWWWLVLVIGLVFVATEVLRGGTPRQEPAAATKRSLSETDPDAVTSERPGPAGGDAVEHSWGAQPTEGQGMPEWEPEAPTQVFPPGEAAPSRDPDHLREIWGPDAAQQSSSGGAPSTGANAESLVVPKGAHDKDQVEDACGVNAATGIAVVSDGAGSAYMSREWSSALVAQFLTDPDLNATTFRSWLGTATSRWGSGDAQDWWAKDSEGRGSSATLLGLVTQRSEQAPAGQWRSVAVGDSCLVHLAANGDDYRPVVSFPMLSSGDFGRHPDLLHTAPVGDQEAAEVDLPTLWHAEGEFRSGDVFLLMTDALAQWALDVGESDPRVWSFLVSVDPAGFHEAVRSERAAGRMEDDDTTLLRISG